MQRSACAVILLALFTTRLVAAEPWQPIPRRLPPPGVAISESDRKQLTDACEQLASDLAARAGSAELAPLAVDVEIYLKAVRFALDNDEFMHANQVPVAHEQLRAGRARLDELPSSPDKPVSWAAQRGLVVRGYRSAVDGSIQPYALEISQQLDLSQPVPLYVWLHGRGDKLTDLAFIHEHGKKPGQLQPTDAIVLHPFGRSCLGWKSTAEIDVLEAIESVCQRYPIDRDRIVLAGFSMGGAGAWHLGAHYAERFAAVHAGAGFVDVARYQRLAPPAFPPAYEQTMWSVYDVPGYVRNLFNLPVIAYSGELDKQKDAADFMGEVFEQHGQSLPHAVGPGMGHKYDPEVLTQIMARLQAAVVQGRDTAPLRVSLQTRTLRYNRMHWVEALALDHHWQDSRIDARYTTARHLDVSTANVSRLRLQPPQALEQLTIDGQELSVPAGPLLLDRQQGTWQLVAEDRSAGAPAPLRKRPGQQGPIDDALLEPFLVVTPTGSSSAEIDRWVAFELEHLRRRWQSVYRGILPEVRDVDLQADQLERYHLLCFGDAQSNAVLRKVADQLPIVRRDGAWQVGERQFDAARHLPLLICPNPLASAKYLVVNSGPTHREAHDRTNSLQNPKLGDWAIVDIRQAPSDEQPGAIVAAGVFDESWQLPQMSTP